MKRSPLVRQRVRKNEENNDNRRNDNHSPNKETGMTTKAVLSLKSVAAGNILKERGNEVVKVNKLSDNDKACIYDKSIEGSSIRKEDKKTKKRRNSHKFVEQKENIVTNDISTKDEISNREKEIDDFLAIQREELKVIDDETRINTDITKKEKSKYDKNLDNILNESSILINDSHLFLDEIYNTTDYTNLSDDVKIQNNKTENIFNNSFIHDSSTEKEHDKPQKFILSSNALSKLQTISLSNFPREKTRVNKNIFGSTEYYYQVVSNKKQFTLLQNNANILYANLADTPHGMNFIITKSPEIMKNSSERLGYIRKHEMYKRFTYYIRDENCNDIFSEAMGLYFSKPNKHSIHCDIVIPPLDNPYFPAEKSGNLSRLAKNRSVPEKFYQFESSSDAQQPSSDVILQFSDNNVPLLVFKKISGISYSILSRDPFTPGRVFAFAISYLISKP